MGFYSRYLDLPSTQSNVLLGSFGIAGIILRSEDCSKDEEGAAAVYRELGANPTSVQGLNACMDYGALLGHQTATADAIEAYVQAYLKSDDQTWIELPPELRPSWWRQKFARPVVLLLRALYRAPGSRGAVGSSLERRAQVYGW